MITRRRTLATMTALATPALAGRAEAQADYPSKQINFILGFAPGGGADSSTRWIADYVREKWKVTTVVENRAGAGATIAAKAAGDSPLAVAALPADGDREDRVGIANVDRRPAVAGIAGMSAAEAAAIGAIVAGVVD